MKSSIGLFYQLTVRDKNGKVVRKTRLRRSRSFTIAFLKMLEIHMYPSLAVNIKDTLGATNSCTENLVTFKSEQPVGNNNGIGVGSGTTPPTNADFEYETQITNGTGGGQLQYGATSKTAAQVVGANVDFIFTRTFVNGSGGDVVVTEAGIIATCYSAANKNCLMIHDVFGAVTVTNGQTLTLNYTLRTTV